MNTKLNKLNTLNKNIEMFEFSQVITMSLELFSNEKQLAIEFANSTTTINRWKNGKAKPYGQTKKAILARIKEMVVSEIKMEEKILHSTTKETRAKEI